MDAPQSLSSTRISGRQVVTVGKYKQSAQNIWKLRKRGFSFTELISYVTDLFFLAYFVACEMNP